MIDNLLTVAQQVAILFVLIGVGAAMRWLRLLTDKGIEGLVNLLILVVTPCLIVDVFQRPFDPSMLRGLGIAALIAVLGHFVVIAIARCTVHHPDEDVERPLRLAAVFSNAGFMGIPLEHALLGDKGVFYGIIYVAVFNLVIWSWGVSQMKKVERRGEGGGFRMSLHSVVNPGTIGIVLGLPLFFLSARLPEVLHEPVHALSNLNTPVAMVVIGYFLAGAKLGRVVRMPAVYVATGVRLVAYPLLMILTLSLVRTKLDREMMLALTIAASAPVAAMVSMFATKYGRDVDVCVAIVSGSTILSVVTMPVVIALAMAVL